MPEPDKLRGARILVVEDIFLFAEMISDALRDEGCIVVGPAPSLEHGLALTRTETLDAALLDINLNGERSFPIAAALCRSRVPFIFLTGYSDIVIPAGLQQVPVLRKPATDLEVIEALWALLAARRKEVP